METFLGIMIPFLGTALGAACVLSLIHISLRLRFLLHFLAIYSAAFFRFLIFVRNVPKAATVLTLSLIHI